MTRSPTWSRRRFLRAASLAAATPALAPQIVTAATRRPPPSERLTMGLIGCGGMGRANLFAFMDRGDVEIIAVCDPDRSRREATAADVATRTGRTGPAAYTDYRELLARADVEAVIIATPDHWHALQVVHAARAGKDIYGEKPLSLTVAQGRVMSDTVRRYGRVFQTGSQQRSDRRFHHACELVRNGRIGRVRTVTCGLPAGAETANHPAIPVPAGFDYDLWLGPAPAAPYCEKRTHYVFRNILDYSGGQLTDWAAHHVDIAQSALGTTTSGPTRIDGTGEFPRDGLWDAAVQYDITCTYESGVELRLTSRFENGVEFRGDAGRIFVNRGRIEADPPALLQETIGPGEIRLERSNDHRANFLECVRSRRDPVAPIEHAHRSISIAHLGNISMRLGRPIRWDPVREHIPGDDTAARMLDRATRSPWRL